MRRSRRPVSLMGVLALAACGYASDSRGREEASIIENVVYGQKHGLAMVFNVFRPDEPNGLGIIFVNSGAWISPFRPFVTDDERGGRRLMTIAELNALHDRWGEFSPEPLLDAGYTVFEVRHGSSPLFLIPDIVADVRRAVRYIHLHSEDYGVEATRLGLWGGSAGGHLALMLGLGSEIGPSPQRDMVDEAPGRVAAVVSYFPVSDLGRWETPERLAGHPAADFDRALYPDYSPINLVSGDDPPTLIIHGDQDGLVPLPQGEAIHDALSAVSVTTGLIVVEGATHGFQGEDAKAAAQAMVEWFDEHLGR